MRRTILSIGSLLFLIGAVCLPAQKQEPSRVPLVSDPQDPYVAKEYKVYRERFGQIPTTVAVAANAPAFAKVMDDFRNEFGAAARMDRAILELSILRITQLEGGEYSYVHSLPVAKGCGITQTQIDALPRWRESALFNAKQRAVLAYADGMMEKAGPDDATFKTLSSFFQPSEIVELTLTNGAFAMSSLYTKALRVPLEKSWGTGALTGGCEVSVPYHQIQFE